MRSHHQCPTLGQYLLHHYHCDKLLVTLGSVLVTLWLQNVSFHQSHAPHFQKGLPNLQRIYFWCCSWICICGKQDILPLCLGPHLMTFHWRHIKQQDYRIIKFHQFISISISSYNMYALTKKLPVGRRCTTDNCRNWWLIRIPRSTLTFNRKYVRDIKRKLGRRTTIFSFVVNIYGNCPFSRDYMLWPIWSCPWDLKGVFLAFHIFEKKGGVIRYEIQ